MDQERYFDDLRRIRAVFGSGLQVDAQGNCNLVGLRWADGTWQVRGPGCAGLPSLTGPSTRWHLYLQEHSLQHLVPQVDFVSLVGDPAERRRLGLPAPIGAPHPIARFEWNAEGLVLTTTVPGTTLEAVQQRTGFPIRRAARVEEVRPPSRREIDSYQEWVLLALEQH